MSFSLSLEASSSNWAQIRLVTSSLTSLPRKMMRSRSSRSKTWSSKEAPPPRITKSSTLMGPTLSPGSRTDPASPEIPRSPSDSPVGELRVGGYRCRVPEGHTIHRLAARHRELFAGRTVRVESPQGRFTAGAALIDGRRLVDTEAYGKHL